MANGIKKDQKKNLKRICGQLLSWKKRGDPDKKGVHAEIIIKTTDSRRAGLILMGTHGRTSLGYMLLGNVQKR